MALGELDTTLKTILKPHQAEVRNAGVLVGPKPVKEARENGT
jgi:hypothetical protein